MLQHTGWCPDAWGKASWILTKPITQNLQFKVWKVAAALHGYPWCDENVLLQIHSAVLQRRARTESDFVFCFVFPYSHLPAGQQPTQTMSSGKQKTFATSRAKTKTLPHPASVTYSKTIRMGWGSVKLRGMRQWRRISQALQFISPSPLTSM